MTEISDGMDDLAARKSRGAFYTPARLTRFVCDWAIRNGGDRVLEPSCGDGAFLVAAAARLSSLGAPAAADLVGLDVHSASAATCATTLVAAGYTATVRTGDFFDEPARHDYDVVIGNPPFVRYQDFSGDARLRAREAALRAGVCLTALASSWAAFVVHATQFVRPGGRLALVLPAELLTVNYAAAVRSHLLGSFGTVRLVVFAERVFPDVLEEVVLLLADDAGRRGGTDHFELVQVDNLADLPGSPVASAAPRLHTPVRTADKWSAAFLSDTATSTYRALFETGHFDRLQVWGETTLGAVTGNNYFFTLTPLEAAAMGLGEDETFPISPPGSRHLRRLTLTPQAWTDLGEAGRRTLLFRPGPDRASMSAAALSRIVVGERDGVDRGYKCRNRKPWWRVPLVDVPDLFLTYMNADTPRLATNSARVRHLNSVHGVYLRAPFTDLGRSLLAVASVNTVTMLGAELVGRSYGGGILKLEPREADELPVPSPSTVQAKAVPLRAARPRVRRALHNGDVAAAARIVDDILWATDTAHGERARTALIGAHADFARRRTSRSTGTP